MDRMKRPDQAGEERNFPGIRFLKLHDFGQLQADQVNQLGIEAMNDQINRFKSGRAIRPGICLKCETE